MSLEHSRGRMLLSAELRRTGSVGLSDKPPGSLFLGHSPAPAASAAPDREEETEEERGSAASDEAAGALGLSWVGSAASAGVG
jgi:hypothetical protein